MERMPIRIGCDGASALFRRQSATVVSAFGVVPLSCGRSGGVRTPPVATF